MELTKFLDVGMVENGDYNVVARCVLRPGEPVKLQGTNEVVLQHLAAGVPGIDAQLLTPGDGMMYLRAVQEAFGDYPFSTSAIIEGEPPTA